MNQQAQPNQLYNPNQIATNVAARKKAELLFRTMIELTRDEVNKLSPLEKSLFIECGCAFFQRQFAKQVEKAIPAREEGSAAKPRQPDQPVKMALALSFHVEQFIDALRELIELCDEIPLAGEDFAASVASSAADMIETVSRMGTVTDAQLQAYENWHGGVRRWLR